MSDVASYITGIRARGISATEISDANLTIIITEALSEFSRHRPIIVDTTFETVADQQCYAWSAIDADGLTAMLIIWNPYQTGDEWDLARTAATFGIPREAGYWHLPSQEVLEQIKASAWNANYGGSGYQIDDVAGEVYLSPVPDETGETVYILYTKAHAAVTTIPASDRDIFLDLLESMVATRVANEIGKASSAVRVRTPEYERQVGEQLGYWRAVARDKRAQFLSKCGAGKAACART